MKIGIIGGSFDPIHIGHLIIGEFSLNVCGLDKIIYVPTGISPHKIYKTKVEDRIKMVEMAIRDNPDFELDTVEADSQDISYTIDTLKYLSDKYPDDKLYFIIGQDNLWDIESWKGVHDYHKYIEIILTDRIYKKSDRTDFKIKDLRDRFGLKVTYIDTPIIELSSQKLRDRIKDGKSIKYLTCEEVRQYIDEKGLYR